MVRDLRKLFVAVKDNEVVLYGTNLSSFVGELNDMKFSDRNYAYFNREFKKNSKMTVQDKDGCTYHLQQVK